MDVQVEWEKSQSVIDWLRKFDGSSEQSKSSGIVLLAGMEAVRAVRAARLEGCASCDPAMMDRRRGESRFEDIQVRKENAYLRNQVSELELEVFRLQSALKRQQEPA